METIAPTGGGGAFAREITLNAIFDKQFRFFRSREHLLSDHTIEFSHEEEIGAEQEQNEGEEHENEGEEHENEDEYEDEDEDDDGVEYVYM